MDKIAELLSLIDFEPEDEDKQPLYIYLHNHLAGTSFEFDNDEYRPPKSFKVVLREILKLNICAFPAGAS